MSEANATLATHRLQCIAGVTIALVYAALGAIVMMQETIPWYALLWSVLLAVALIVLSLIDLATLRLPNVGTISLATIGLLASAHLSPAALITHAGAGLGGFAFLSLLNTSYRALRGRDGIGGGDAKLIAAAGMWTGPWGLVSVLLWSTLTALLAFLALSLVGREVSRHSQLPFGPFLALAIWITWCFGPLQVVP